MNKAVLHSDVQDFIQKNLSTDLAKLVLKGSPFAEVSIQEIAQQIKGKQQIRNKLPNWFATPGLFYPPGLNLEQTSSEVTANYKANLVKGSHCVDLTGGFGIDSFFLSKKFTTMMHCELDPSLSIISQHNAQVLGNNNLSFYQGDGFDYLASTEQPIDCIYADPSRRDKSKGKVFLLEDCIPNIPKTLPYLFSKSARLLLKLSPMLDIDLALKSMEYVSDVHVVAVQNEVKELLFLLEKNRSKQTEYHTVNFTKNGIQRFSFVKQELFEVMYGPPLTYLYEPNAAIMKSGGFKALSKASGLVKLHPHSHLYTSEKPIDFPGRRFQILEVLAFSKQNSKTLMKTKANVSTRNFPMSVNDLRKKFKIAPGGDSYIFFTTNIDGQRIILKTEKA